MYNSQMREQKVIVDGICLNYVEVGEGPVVLFLHGWGDTHAGFLQLLDELRLTNNRVILPDLPGFGGSEYSESIVGLDDYVNLVNSFLAKCDVTTLSAIVAHSFGGRIAIKGTSQEILKPEKLVLIGAAGLAQSDSLRNRLFATVAKIGKVVFSLPLLSALHTRTRNFVYRLAGAEDYLLAGPLQNTFIRVIKENLAAEAKKINIPALLIWGDRDDMTPLSEGEQMRELIAGSQLHILEGSHTIHKEKPAEVARLINNFLP
jgi:pimeloyl-ACP methyl ester carboxylesterase